MKVYITFLENTREIDRVFLNKVDALLYVVTEDMAYKSNGKGWEKEANKLIEEHKVI